MLLEQGALCERDTFQGERCLYNALNDRIRNLLLSYDYSKSTDPLQPLAAHITALLTRDTPKTSDITVQAGETTFELHKFILSARSPYFARKFEAAPETVVWRLSNNVPPQSFATSVRYLYLGDVGIDHGYGVDEQDVLTGVDKLSRQLEIPQLFEHILSSSDRRLARQKRTEEIERGRDQMLTWFENNVIKHKVHVDTEHAGGVKWVRDNSIFADVLLQSDEDYPEDEEVPEERSSDQPPIEGTNGIPIGGFNMDGQSTTKARKPRRSVLYPCHRAMLLRSEVFATMFASPFREGQESEHLQIVPVDCAPEVLEIVLTFLYTEKADFPLHIALDVLTASDMLFIEKLKQRAALLISTLGNGNASVVESENPRGEIHSEDIIDIYDVVRAGWDTRVHRLEEFGARYIAYRLERYIDEPEFKALVRDSAARIQARQETDTVELVDDIRYYLSERFRLRFEDAGLGDMMDGQDYEDREQADEIPDQHQDGVKSDAPSARPPQSLSNLGLDQGVVRTLDGELAGDEFAQDAINYQILLGKIESLMDSLGLDG